MTFEKGKPVSILDDPQGTPWVMQAFSHIVDSNLTYDELEKLGDTLKPAPGWECRVWPTLTVNSQSRQFDGVAVSCKTRSRTPTTSVSRGVARWFAP